MTNLLNALRAITGASPGGAVRRALAGVLTFMLAASAAADDIRIANYRLHIACVGRGAPTVVLDAGLGGSALEWVFVAARLRETTRVCTYDRAGYGDSDMGPAPRTSSMIANELYLLLDGAGEPAPYILVGHSFGGYNMQLFARRYPFLAAGLVLIDASHPEQVERFLAPPLRMLTAPSNRYGIVQFREPPPPHALLPDSLRSRIIGRARTWKTRRTVGNELLGFRDSARELRAAPPLGDLPLIVITRGRTDGQPTVRRRHFERLWLELQSELAGSSTAAAHLVARNSGHYVHIEQPELVAFAIDMLVERYRASVSGGSSSGLTTARAAAHFKLDDAAWLKDSLSLYPETVVTAEQDVICVAALDCTGESHGAP